MNHGSTAQKNNNDPLRIQWSQPCWKR